MADGRDRLVASLTRTRIPVNFCQLSLNSSTSTHTELLFLKIKLSPSLYFSSSDCVFSGRQDAQTASH